MLYPWLPCWTAAPKMTSSISDGSSPAFSIDAFIEKLAKVGASVSLKDPLYAFPIAVLAVDKITAWSRMSSF